MKEVLKSEGKGTLSKCQCAINHERKDKVIQTKDKFGEKFTICICKNCGLIRQQKMMTPHETQIYYSSGQYRDDDKTNEQFKSLDELYQHQRHKGKLKIQFINKNLKVDLESKNFFIVDFGGGTGGLYEDFKNKHNILIIDHDKNHIKHATQKGYKTICGGLDELNSLQKNPDLLILSHVFEHFIDLNNAIRIIKNIISDNTILYLEIPAIDYFFSEYEGYDYRQMHHNSHNYYFTKSVVNNIFNKNGFKTIASDDFSRNLFIHTNEKQKEINFYKQSICFIYKLNFLMKYFNFKKFIKKIPGVYGVYVIFKKLRTKV